MAQSFELGPKASTQVAPKPCRVPGMKASPPWRTWRRARGMLALARTPLARDADKRTAEKVNECIAEVLEGIFIYKIKTKYDEQLGTER